MATDSSNLKIRRVPAASNDAFMQTTPSKGSIYYIESDKSIRIGDGYAKGGIRVLTYPGSWCNAPIGFRDATSGNVLRICGKNEQTSDTGSPLTYTIIKREMLTGADNKPTSVLRILSFYRGLTCDGPVFSTRHDPDTDTIYEYSFRPASRHEGKIGTLGYEWCEAYIDNIFTGNLEATNVASYKLAVASLSVGSREDTAGINVSSTSIHRGRNDSYIVLSGSQYGGVYGDANYEDVPALVIYGNDYVSENDFSGRWLLRATDKTNKEYANFIGTGIGAVALTARSPSISCVNNTRAATATGSIGIVGTYDAGINDSNVVHSGINILHRGVKTGLRLAASPETTSPTSSTAPEYILFDNCVQYANTYSMGFYPASTGTISLGRSNHIWKDVWASTTTISTSDERAKTDIARIPDAVLDAWGDIAWYQYRMTDSVEKKGFDAARIHTGVIAQRIDSVFRDHGLDASRYGLFCHDEWEATPEETDESGTVVVDATEAGDSYAVRYEEALCIEAAYQRRRADMAEARLAELEKRMEKLEAVLA